MIYRLQILCSGSAALVDTVILVWLLEPRNLRRVPLPALLVAVGVWILHVAGFVRGMIENAQESLAAPVHWGSMTAMVVGLTLMPCAMTHLIVRTAHTGLAPWPKIDFRYALLYLPMLAVLPAERRIAHHPMGWFVEILSPMIVPYVVWITAVSILAAIGALVLRTRLRAPRDRQLLIGLATSLLMMSAIFVAILVYGTHSPGVTLLYLQLVAFAAPLIPVLLFGYFVVRFNYLRLVVERTTIYAAVIVAVLLAHWVFVRSLAHEWEQSLRVDIGVLEAMVAILAIIIVQPLRERVSEAIRYLFRREPAGKLRERIRQLVVNLSKQAEPNPDELLRWFVEQSAEPLNVDYVAGWRWDESGAVAASFGMPTSMTLEQVQQLRSDLKRAEPTFLTPRDAPTRRTLQIMHECRASGVVLLEHEEIHGLILFGPRHRFAEFGEEEASALTLVTEQLAAAMHARTLEAARQLEQRRALQNEKLSTLGLIAGSIVHEIKNPLSSIRTIATVLAEDLGPDSPHAGDIEIILGEISRLSNATNELLHFVRPPSQSHAHTPVARVIASVVQVLGHLAAQRNIKIETAPMDDDARVGLADEGLHEIFFNLLSNAIEAMGENGRVRVTGHLAHDRWVGEVADDGPGISDTIARQLFEPFVTTKQEGTGLGLFAVRRRVEEAGGEITVDRPASGGTSFQFWLPILRENASNPDRG